MGQLRRLRPRKNPARHRARTGSIYVLRLFTTGTTPRSTRAIRNLHEICEAILKGRYELEVIDIYQEPGRASENDIIAAPTLLKDEPAPARRMVGDLSDREKVLSHLDIMKATK
jgi:circadian clock protein KaiB